METPHSLDALIRRTYGSRAEMDRQLGLPERTTDRWYRKSPVQFFKHTPKIAEQMQVPETSIALAIWQHVRDVAGLGEA